MNIGGKHNERVFPARHELEETAQLLESLARDLRALDSGELDMGGTHFVELAQWSLSTRTALCLTGVAIGHPLRGTRPIRTSEVFHLDLDARVARTLSRWYRLSLPLETPPSFQEH